MCVLAVCKLLISCVPGACGGQTRETDSLRPGSQGVVSHHVGAGNQTSILWKRRRQEPQLQRHRSIPLLSYMYECFAYMCVWAPHMCLAPTEARRKCWVL